MRRSLDFLYDAAAWLAALAMIGVLAMVLASILGRLLHFNLAGSDAYAGYCMAAAGFLALAHTLKKGEHIRVTLVINRLSDRAHRWLDVFCHVVALLVASTLAFYSVRLVQQSLTFNDISTGLDATPLWCDLVQQAKTFRQGLQAQGTATRWMELPQEGIRGNSHMLMMDDNSDAVAERVCAWLREC